MKVACANALSNAFHACCNAVTEEAQLQAWSRLFMFAKTVLRWVNLGRGGNKGRNNRNHKFTSAIRARLDRWNRGEYQSLWDEAFEERRSTVQAATPPSTTERNIRRAIKECENGRLSKAVAALVSCGIAPHTAETYAEMLAKHPVAAQAPRPNVTARALEEKLASSGFDGIEEKTVRKKVFSFQPGSAAGASGFRPQYLKDILSTPLSSVNRRALTNLTRLVNMLVDGDLPEEIAPYLAGAPLMALVKPDTSLRPIAIGDVFRRLVSKCCCSVVALKAKDLLAPRQIGVAIPAGAEAVIHAVRHMVESDGGDPGKIMLKVDFANAFNTIDRTVFLEETFEHFPQIFRWVAFCYMQPAKLFFGPNVLYSSAGVQQGDPLGPLLFSLGLHRIIRRVEEAQPNLDVNSWYLDDGCLIGDVAQVKDAFDLINTHAEEVGLRLNVAKNELWWPARPDDDSDGFPANVKRQPKQGVELLGCPVGDPEFLERHFERKLQKLAHVDAAIHQIEDAQVELCLLRGCLGFSKINHLLRSCPPLAVRKACQQFDLRMYSILQNILRTPGAMDAFTWAKAALPVKMGGLGLGLAEYISPGAFIGSCAQTHDLTSRILGQPPTTYSPLGLSEATAHLENLCGVHLDYQRLRGMPKVQHKISDCIWYLLSGQLSVEASKQGNLRTQALLLAQELEHANDFVVALPISALGHRVPDQLFHVMLKRYMHIPLFPPTDLPSCTACATRMDVYGDHALVCSRGGGAITRHNLLRDAMRALARSAGYQTRSELPYLLHNTRDKPGDFVVHNLDEANSVTAFDVTVRDTLQRSTLALAAKNPGHLIQVGHQAKIDKYGAACAMTAGLHFYPLAWESAGGASAKVHECLKQWSRLSAKRYGNRYAETLCNTYRQLSIIIQQSNAQRILEKCPIIPSVSDEIGDMIRASLSDRGSTAAVNSRADAEEEPLVEVGTDMESGAQRCPDNFGDSRLTVYSRLSLQIQTMLADSDHSWSLAGGRYNWPAAAQHADDDGVAPTLSVDVATTQGSTRTNDSTTVDPTESLEADTTLVSAVPVCLSPPSLPIAAGISTLPTEDDDIGGQRHFSDTDLTLSDGPGPTTPRIPEDTGASTLMPTDSVEVEETMINASRQALPPLSSSISVLALTASYLDGPVHVPQPVPLDAEPLEIYTSDPPLSPPASSTLSIVGTDESCSLSLSPQFSATSTPPSSPVDSLLVPLAQP
jgi:hypothetical protein